MDLTKLLQKGFASSSKRVAKFCEGISPEESFFRPHDKVNHLAWEVGHTAFVRNTIIKLLNPAEKLDFFENERTMFAPQTPLSPNEMFPALEVMVENYQKRGQRILELLESVTPEHWASTSPYNLPFLGVTIGDHVEGFFLHEQQHLGEMSIVKNIVIRLRA